MYKRIQRLPRGDPRHPYVKPGAALIGRGEKFPRVEGIPVQRTVVGAGLVTDHGVICEEWKHENLNFPGPQDSRSGRNQVQVQVQLN